MVAPAASLVWLHLFSALMICLSTVSAIPTSISKPKNPSGPPPKFVAYADESEFGIPSVKDLKGYTVVILSFLLTKGAADETSLWAQLSPSERKNIKAQYANAGIKLLASAFGSTETPTTSGKDPTDLAHQMVDFVKSLDLDGIDVDYEDFAAVSAGTAFDWLKTFTTVLRDNLPQDKYIITHAPVAPWFGRNQIYNRLHRAVGDKIDWYNIQFYSQGPAYTSCDTLITHSGGDFPGTAALEIVNSGVPHEKVVIGKPASPKLVGDPSFSGGGGGGGGDGSGGGDSGGGGGTQVAGGGTQVASGGTQVASGETQVASSGDNNQAVGGVTRVAVAGPPDGTVDGNGNSLDGTTNDNGSSPPPELRRDNSDPHRNGFLEPHTLAQCLVQAKQQGWSGGVMVWEFPDANSEWMTTVRQQAWPV